MLRSACEVHQQHSERSAHRYSLMLELALSAAHRPLAQCWCNHLIGPRSCSCCLPWRTSIFAPMDLHAQLNLTAAPSNSGSSSSSTSNSGGNSNSSSGGGSSSTHSNSIRNSQQQRRKTLQDKVCDGRTFIG